MRPARLSCPHARYNAHMYIDCDKTGEMCAHQRWCTMTGWAKLTDMSARCAALREDEGNERKAKAAKKRRNKV